MLKLFKIIFKGILLVLAATVLLNAAVLLTGYLNMDSDYSPESSGKNPDCILVLGAAVRPDGTPSKALQARLDTGIRLYKAGAAKKLLLSGDNGQTNYNEVESMKDYVLAAGVPSEDIFLDHAGFSTYESMYRARDVFKVKKPIIVTQKYHEYRALFTARMLGLHPIGVPCSTSTISKSSDQNVREYLARCKAVFQCIAKPKPTFLGSAIPISGNGTASW